MLKARGAVVAAADVGVKLPNEAAVARLDLLLGSEPGHAQDGVVVTAGVPPVVGEIRTRHRHSSPTTSRTYSSSRRRLPGESTHVVTALECLGCELIHTAIIQT